MQRLLLTTAALLGVAVVTGVAALKAQNAVRNPTGVGPLGGQSLLMMAPPSVACTPDKQLTHTVAQCLYSQNDAADVAGAHQQDAMYLGMTASHGSTPRVTLFVEMTANPGNTSGYWVENPILNLNGGLGNVAATANETDVNNGNRDYPTGSGPELANPGLYGIHVAGLTSYPGTAAYAVDGGGSAKNWHAGFWAAGPTAVGDETFWDTTSAITSFKIGGSHFFGIDSTSATVSLGAIALSALTPAGSTIGYYGTGGVAGRLLGRTFTDNVGGYHINFPNVGINSPSLAVSGTVSDQSEARQTSGSSYSVASHVGRVILDGVNAAYTLIMPASPTDGQPLVLECGSVVTTLTVRANTGQIMKGTAPNCSSTQGHRWTYNAAGTAWYMDY